MKALAPITVSVLPKQKRFLQSAKRLVIFLAGIGSGKTLIASWWSVIRASKGRRVIVLEPTFGMCRDVFLPTLKEVLDKMSYVVGVHYTINLTNLNIDFVGGGQIMLRSADAIESLRGINADDGLIDEFGSLPTDYCYKVLLGRCRRSDDAQIKLVGTPTQRRWLRDIILEAGDDVEVIRQATTENTFLPKSYIDALIKEYGIDTPWYRQEVLGELVDFGSGIFNTDMIVYAPHAQRYDVAARAWDTASSSRTQADWTASGLVSKGPGGMVIVHDVRRRKGAYANLRDWMIQTMLDDGPGVTQWIENTAAGQVIISDLLSDSRTHRLDIRPIEATKDKLTRALPFSARMANGLVVFGPGPWHKDALEEFNAFPKTEHDDQVDAVVHAYNALEEETEAVIGSYNIY